MRWPEERPLIAVPQSRRAAPGERLPASGPFAADDSLELCQGRTFGCVCVVEFLLKYPAAVTYRGNSFRGLQPSFKFSYFLFCFPNTSESIAKRIVIAPMRLPNLTFSDSQGGFPFLSIGLRLAQLCDRLIYFTGLQFRLDFLSRGMGPTSFAVEI
jgi:hypothetical protein